MMMELGATVSALKAVGQMCVMILVGMSAAHRHIISPQTMKTFSGLVTGVFTPALLFGNLSAGTSSATVMKCLILPFVAFSCCGAGMALGYVARRTFLKNHITHEQSRLLQAACTIGNSQGLPLVLTGALVSDNEWVECVRYISLYIVSVHIVTWFGLYNWLKESTQQDESEIEDGIPDERTPLLSEGGVTPVPLEKRSPPTVTAASLLQRFKSSINPPVIAICLGLFFGLFQPAHHQFARPGAPLKWIHDAIVRVGQGAVPLVMTILGSSMYFSLQSGHSTKRLPLIATLTITVIRLFCVPLVGIAYVYMFRPYLDNLLCLVILIESCSPTANNVTVICSRLGIDPVPLGGSYLVQYAVAIPLYSIYLAFALMISQGSPLDSQVQV